MQNKTILLFQELKRSSTNIKSLLSFFTDALENETDEEFRYELEKIINAIRLNISTGDKEIDMRLSIYNLKINH